MAEKMSFKKEEGMGMNAGEDMARVMGMEPARETARAHLLEVPAGTRDDAAYAAWRRGLAYTERVSDILKEKARTTGFPG